MGHVACFVVLWGQVPSVSRHIEFCKRLRDFSVVYFSRGTLPQQRNGKSKRALLGDLVLDTAAGDSTLVAADSPLPSAALPVGRPLRRGYWCRRAPEESAPRPLVPRKKAARKGDLRKDTPQLSGFIGGVVQLVDLIYTVYIYRYIHTNIIDKFLYIYAYIYIFHIYFYICFHAVH